MATLKELVNETTNIKDELKTCHSNLSSALTEKGVSVTSEDKMPNLIDKINSLKVQTNIPIAGTGVVLYYREEEKATKYETTVDTFTYNGEDGSVRVSFLLAGASNGDCYAYIKLNRNNTLINDKTVTINSSSYVKCSVDLDVKKGDTITLSQKFYIGSSYCYSKYTTISCDYLIV